MRLRRASIACRRSVSLFTRHAKRACGHAGEAQGPAFSPFLQRVVFALRECRGQGSVEYALVLFAFLGVLAGLGLLGDLLDAGVLLEHALQSASHHISSAAPGAFSDVFMY